MFTFRTSEMTVIFGLAVFRRLWSHVVVRLRDRVLQLELLVLVRLHGLRGRPFRPTTAATSLQTVFVGLSGEGGSSGACFTCLAQMNLTAS